MQTTFLRRRSPPPTAGDWLRRVLVVLLPVAVVCAGIFMLHEIEMLIGFLPACSLLGLWLALAAAPLRSWVVVLYAVSAPVVAAACAAAIYCFGLGPQEAYVPINSVWWVYLAIAVLSCWAPIWRVWRRDDFPAAAPRPKWRFSIKSLLILTTALAVLLAAGRVYGEALVRALFGRGGYAGFANVALLGFVLVGLAIANALSHRTRGVGLFRKAADNSRLTEAADGEA